MTKISLTFRDTFLQKCCIAVENPERTMLPQEYHPNPSQSNQEVVCIDRKCFYHKTNTPLKNKSKRHHPQTLNHSHIKLKLG